MDKPQEKKVLGILAIIFGGIGLVFSWVPIVNNVAAFFAIIGLILGIIALIRNRKAKKILALIGTIISAAAFVIVLATQSMYSSAIDKATNSSSESSSIEKSDNKSSNKSAWSFKDNTFKTDNLTYKFTKSEIMDSSSQDGSKVIVIYADVTNTSDKDQDPSDAYMYIHAYQKTDTTNKSLNVGMVALDENANNPLQQYEDAMNNDLLPHKTASVVLVYSLENTNTVTVKFDNNNFDNIGSKNYSAQ